MPILSAGVGIVTVPSSNKTDAGVSGMTILCVVSKDTDSCHGEALASTSSIESFLVTVCLQGHIRFDQRLPRVTTQ